MRVEDIILSNDKKGISKIKKYLDKNFCKNATKFILQNCKRTIIVTGFYVNGTCETDGLVGAINLARVLSNLGADITFITDKYCSNIIREASEFSVMEFPLGEIDPNFLENLINEVNPTLIISIERCGKNIEDRYYNFKGEDITKFTAKLDLLFEKISNSVAIGDTGNEIGMGNLYEQIKEEKVLQNPSITKTNHLIISSISNWGCYGVIAYISRFLKKDYINKINDRFLLLKLNSFGVVDGITSKNEPSVDGYSTEETKEILTLLSNC